jgi:hypothetical protein
LLPLSAFYALLAFIDFVSPFPPSFSSPQTIHNPNEMRIKPIKAAKTQFYNANKAETVELSVSFPLSLSKI